MGRILLVEDNEMNRDMLARRLGRQGHEVLIAISGEEVQDLCLSQHPQVVLMDISLPGIDGWEATRRLKADPRTAHVPVIALTAHAMASDRRLASEAGCDDFDTKPVEFQRLLAKLDAQLRKVPGST